MQISVGLDLGGEMRLVFDETSVNLIDKSLTAGVRGELFNRRIAKNEPIAYDAIDWIGEVRIPQAGMLLMGVPCTLLGLLWTVAYFGEWGPWAFSVVFLVLLGLWPLSIYRRGRPFLAIASPTQIIAIPMDRKLRKLRRILGLLQQVCPTTGVTWELGNGPLADRQSWTL